MGRTERDQLFNTLSSHINNTNETFQIFDQAPVSSSKKVSWEEVVKMGDRVSLYATVAGMLRIEKPPVARHIEQHMERYFNTLQGFLLLSYGSTVGAGPTLSSCVHAAVKEVVDSSLKLFRESVSSFGANEKCPIPQLVGAVWEACSALGKTPGTNITAIGRAMTQVVVSMKDVLREMKELKPGSTDLTDDISDQACTKAESEPQDDGDDGLSEGDLGNDLSPEEMKVAQSTITVVSETLIVIEELIRSITSLLKIENPKYNGGFVDSLEILLKQCQEIGEEVDELGACLYPPQEVPKMRAAVEKISSTVDDMQTEVESLKGTSEAFLQACNGLKGSLTQLNSQLYYSSSLDLEAEMQKVDLNN
ncbi:Cyclin-D1-binding protein [Parasponia andersonii]|uniref:Cyclin-D1-binding protein n=1 Tax=Parasponia andersonii TaxID=3476 RepID=A0A2P5DKA3_PARAD|nr:Cyclin-D1-binding protein [Parasponia andersonii]